MRGMSIYGDNVFVSTSDARLVAMDARTGRPWQTTIGDHRRQLQHEQRSLLAKGQADSGLGGCQTYREEKCFISA